MPSIRHWFKTRDTRTKRRSALRKLSELESLESRVVLYSTTGNLWPNPGLITISFMPDGTNLGGPLSNLNSTFNAKPALNQAGNGWQSIVLKAAQSWAAQTNINFALVPDNGAPSGAAGNQQGDPGYGDIRIGGYNFGTSTLARAFQPPPQNNYSVAGDVAFNTGAAWNVNTTYDLYTVAVHELGHALGMDHSSASAQTVMYPTYNGVKSSLSADDVAGIRNIYSGNAARNMDTFDAAGVTDNTFATATSLNGKIGAATLTASATGLDISSTSDVDYLSATVPSGTTGTLTLNVQSAGISLLSPKVTVYASDQKTVLGAATALGKDGTTLSLSVSKLIAGQQVYLAVQGSDATVFGTGSYDLGLSFGAGAAPTFAANTRAIAAGVVLTAGGGIADTVNTEEDHYTNQTPTVTGIVDDTGASANDNVTKDNKVQPMGTAAAGVTVTVYLNGASIGTTAAIQNNTWSLTTANLALADGTYAFTATATDPSGNVSPLSDPVYVRVDTASPAAPTITGVTPDTGLGATDGIINISTPTVVGTAEPGARVQVYRNGQNVGTTTADGIGRWAWTNNSLAAGTWVFTATATDVAGNTGALGAPDSVTIDLQAPNQPTVTGISPDSGALDGVTNSQRLVFAGTAEAASLVQVSLNGVVAGSTIATAAGTWSFNDTANLLAPGGYAVTATATDVAGNASQASSAFQAAIDPNMPTITGISPDTGAGASDGVTSAQKIKISGTVAPNDRVNVFLNGNAIGSTTAGPTGAWTFDDTGTTLAQGAYAVTATGTGATNVTSKASTAYNVTIDTTAPLAPALVSFSPDTGAVGDGITSCTTPTLAGTAEASSTVQVYRNGVAVGTATAGPTGGWSYASAPLADGTYVFTATATDAAGNVGAASATFNLTIKTKVALPAFTGISPDTGAGASDQVTKSRNLKVSGTGEPGSTVSLSRDGAPIGSVVVASTGAWTFDYSQTTLADGTYNFTARATDAAANVSAATAPFKVVVVNAVSPPAINGVTETVAGAQTLTPQGTVRAGSLVQVFLNGTALGTTTADATGAWAYNYSVNNLPTGTYTFTAIATDLAGNVSAASSAFKLVLGNGAPTVGTPGLTSSSTSGSTGGYFNATSATPTLVGNAAAGSLVTILDGDAVLGTVVADSGGHWTFLSPALAKGKHTLRASASTSAGLSGLLSNALLVSV